MAISDAVEDASAAWSLAPLGWRHPERPPSRSSCEFVAAGSWAVARLWTTPCRLESRALSAGTYRLILGVDGAAEIDAEGMKSRIEPGQLLIVRGSTPIRTENQELWARFEWHLAASELDQTRHLHLLQRAQTVSADYFQLLTSVLNTLSTLPGLESAPGATRLRAALTDLSLAAVSDKGLLPDTLSESQAEVLHRALLLIDAEFRDPDLNVATLSTRLNISEPYLYRVFALSGTTPRAVIESRRARTASELMSRGAGWSDGALRSHARRAGFSTTRQMKAAVERQLRAPSPI